MKKAKFSGSILFELQLFVGLSQAKVSAGYISHLMAAYDVSYNTRLCMVSCNKWLINNHQGSKFQ